jgi:hypothetical protein
MDQGQIIEIALAQRFFDATESPRLRAFSSVHPALIAQVQP